VPTTIASPATQLRSAIAAINGVLALTQRSAPAMARSLALIPEAHAPLAADVFAYLDMYRAETLDANRDEAWTEVKAAAESLVISLQFAADMADTGPAPATAPKATPKAPAAAAAPPAAATAPVAPVAATGAAAESAQHAQRQAEADARAEQRKATATAAPVAVDPKDALIAQLQAELANAKAAKGSLRLGVTNLTGDQTTSGRVTVAPGGNRPYTMYANQVLMLAESPVQLAQHLKANIKALDDAHVKDWEAFERRCDAVIAKG
jgi:hypothetical protein